MKVTNIVLLFVLAVTQLSADLDRRINSEDSDYAFSELVRIAKQNLSDEEFPDFARSLRYTLRYCFTEAYSDTSRHALDPTCEFVQGMTYRQVIIVGLSLERLSTKIHLSDLLASQRVSEEKISHIEDLETAIAEKTNLARITQKLAETVATIDDIDLRLKKYASPL